MNETIVTILFIVGISVLPALIVVLSRRIRVLKIISPVIIAYVVGILLGNTGLIPASASGLLEDFSGVLVLLALPLMLFSVNFETLKRLSGKAILAFVLAVVSVTIVAFVGGFLFRSGGPLGVPESWKVTGMLIGVYTGATANMMSIGTALGVSQGVFVAVQTVDVLMSGVYILFLITIGKRILRAILPPVIPSVATTGTVPVSGAAAETGAALATGAPAAAEQKEWRFGEIFSRAQLPKTLTALGFAVLIAGIGITLSFVLPQNIATMATILTVTVLSLVVAFLPPVRKVPFSMELGEYFIYVFCIAVGSMADLRILATATPSLLLFSAFAIFGSLILHIVFCAIFRIDADLMVVVSMSLINSPPFVPVVAVPWKRMDLIPIGIGTGLLGYAVANFVGIGLAQLVLRLWGG